MHGWTDGLKDGWTDEWTGMWINDLEKMAAFTSSSPLSVGDTKSFLMQIIVARPLHVTYERDFEGPSILTYFFIPV